MPVKSLAQDLLKELNILKIAAVVVITIIITEARWYCKNSDGCGKFLCRWAIFYKSDDISPFY